MKACILLVKANNSKYQKYRKETPEIFLHQFIYLLTRVHGSSKMSRVLQVCWQQQDLLLAHFVKLWGMGLTSDTQYRFRYSEDSCGLASSPQVVFALKHDLSFIEDVSVPLAHKDREVLLAWVLTPSRGEKLVSNQDTVGGTSGCMDELVNH